LAFVLQSRRFFFARFFAAMEQQSMNEVSQPSPTPAWAGGSDAPELCEVRVGFIPLTDCASVVMASVLQLDRKHGVRIVLSKEPSWAGVRDKLVHGQLDMAHVLYGLVYGLHLGIGGPKQDMAVLMTLNFNGQGLTLSRALAQRGAVDAVSLAALQAVEGRTQRFAQTFPTGTHAMWLYYWLASAGIHPLRDAAVITVPPAQMVSHLRLGQMDGFSAGEPWNHRAVLDGVGITAATSQQVWPDHPEKVLGCTAEFVRKHPRAARAVTMAVLEASRWIESNAANRQRTAETIAQAAYVATSVAAIGPRLRGEYDDGLGRHWQDAQGLKFFDDGAVNYPYLSDGMWFLTQHKRWGLLRDHPDYLAVAQQINQIDLYTEAASALGINLPPTPMRRSRLIDGAHWDGSDAAAYADAFELQGSAPAALHAA
jgi:nitrate/nitrite transport system substrate-binding protein